MYAEARARGKGAHRKKEKPRTYGGALSCVERPGGSLSAPAAAPASPAQAEQAPRSGLSRLHEHLNFPAETLGANRSGFYREARVFTHALCRS